VISPFLACYRSVSLCCLVVSFLLCFEEVSEHVELTPSEDGQLTETCKDSKHIRIESHWTVSTIIL
jgi:hypothetical protein